MSGDDDIPRPDIKPGQFIAHFQWNYGWGLWEQVVPEVASREGVIAAYAAPSPAVGDREAIARTLYEQWSARALVKSDLTGVQSIYAGDAWANLPASFTRTFYIDADAILALSAGGGSS